ncbi:uncharacterized protein [Hemitrygon akajei]|uniref:uncharacterized protein isoform X3 n=1 Tax=Hemitrygon akajei TaxID=2704970 RepID=UPI003BFA23C4
MFASASIYILLISGFLADVSVANDCIMKCDEDSIINCAKGHYYTLGNCIECPAGFYCPGGVSSPKPCYPGTANYFPGENDITDCKACPDGYISAASSVACRPCPAGSSCDPKEGTLVACDPGSWSPEGVLSCLPCMEGYICPDGNLPQKCPPGSEPNSDHSSCVDCQTGYFSRESDLKCYPCPTGFLCPVPGLISPILCSAGTYQPEPGGSHCIPCPAGSDCTNPSIAVPCPPGTYSVKGGTGCLPCAAGFYNDKSSASNCIKCPAGSFCSPTEAIECEPGYYSEAGMTSCPACPGGFSCNRLQQPKPCGLGKFALNGSISCEDCPRGHQCPYEATIEPIPCPLGYYANRRGQAACKRCEPGSYCENPSSDPVLCPVGKRCETAGLTAAQSCPFGTYTDAEGSTQCQSCPAGFNCAASGLPPEPCEQGTFSLLGETYCQPCPLGTYSNCTGGSVCHVCPPGFACHQPASDPVPCTKGSFSTPGSTFCTSCPPGTYNNGAYPEGCLFCPAGFACPNPKQGPSPCEAGQYSLGNATSCTLCPAGYECSNASSAPKICPAGTFSTSGQFMCQMCAPGFYCPQEGNVAQTRCAPGFFSMMGSELCKECSAGYECPDPSEHPIPCKNGFFSLPGSQNCTSCPEGFRCTDKALPPHLCNAGTFAASNSRECTSCPKGCYCPRDGLSGPIPCPAGWYQENPGQCQCIPCPPGNSCAEKILPPKPCEPGLYSEDSGSEACIPCPAGSYTKSIGSQTCTKCPAGFRCPERSQQPIPCSHGQYSTEGSSQCSPCPLGAACSDPFSNPVQCQVGSITNGTNCLLCPIGYRCPSPFTGPQACSPGTYQDLLGMPNCKVCPPGFHCLDRNGSPEPCAEGFYSSAGAERCSMCPLGQYSESGWEFCLTCPPGQECKEGKRPKSCPAGTYSHQSQGYCQPCPSGTYSGIGWSDCSICPLDYSCSNSAKQLELNVLVTRTRRKHAVSRQQGCPDGVECPNSRDSPNNCTLGFYSLEGQFICLTSLQTQAPCPPGHTTFGKEGINECQPCPAGFACENPQIRPKKCSAGTYSIEGSTLCILCPAGNACPKTSSVPVPCAVGSYSTDGQQNCTMCRPGYACPTTTKAEEIQCLPGSYSLGGQSQCTVCPAGYSCPDTRLDTKIACLSGYYAYVGYASCRACPAGWQCPQRDGSQNTQCPKGSFSIGLQESCIRCPAGKACPSTDTNYSIPCLPGSYSVGYQTECTVCPPGYECPSTTESIVKPCPPGSYSAGGAAACTPCQPGFGCPSRFDVLQITCLPGTFALAGYIQCIQCPAGQQCPFTNATGENCPSGTYSLGGEVACKHCPAGYFCPWPDKLPQPCPAGSYSSHGASSCSSCLPGYTCPEGSNSSAPEEQQCPLGYYCDDSITPKECSPGTYGARKGLQQKSECSACPSGYYCPEGTAGYPSASLLCPKGYYCEEGTSHAHSSPCPPGTSSDQMGLKSQENCKQCSEGRICSAGTVDSGRLCSQGKYCPSGTTVELDCPLGMLTQQRGASGIHMCIKCPPGYYCPSGSSHKIPCQRGTYNPRPGQSNVTDCVLCTAGYACTQVALTRPDARCFAGFVCPIGSSNPQDPENACPPGTFSQFRNLTDKSHCEICPMRSACLEGTGGRYRPSLPCSPGHYCPAGTKYPTEYKCPAGSWSNRTNLASEEECFPCPRGWYCLAGASIPTGRCKSGYYCPLGTQLSSQFPCPPGSYSTRLGNSRVEDCLQCPEGSYCPEATSKPKECPKGTYHSEKGGASILDCQLCPSGFFCSGPGTITPQSCGAGRYSDFGSSSCDLCLLGYYCDGESTSWEVMIKQLICPKGMFCRKGLNRIPDFNKDACPKGYYCLQGNMNPNPRLCPNGTYSDQEGLEDVSQCIPCPAGMYCYSEGTTPKAISQPTGYCPKGHYCPVRTGNPFSFPCKRGFYQSNSAAEGEDSCSQCPTGHYCDTSGLEKPKLCPKGFYCTPESREKPQPCERGTYSNSVGLGTSSACTPCGGGQYCTDLGLTQPTGYCKAGFYCRERATTAAPIDGITGDVCTAGGYCPVGSAFPIPCPMGTFSNTSGLRSSKECLPCPPGLYCSGLTTQAPTGPCRPGYFCTGGASSPTQHGTKEGHYSRVEAESPVPCPLGTFQSASLQSSCLTCSQGRYCNQTGLVIPPLCMQGHYCPPGSILPIPCPVGHYLHQEGAADISSCTLCDPGMYCSVVGLSAPEGPCRPGYYCTGGSNTSIPVAMPFGDICPAGYYCPLGTKHAFENPCPAGTWSNFTSAQDIALCLPCTPGFSCSQTALTHPNELCSPGFYCKNGAKTSRPLDGETGGLCPKGYYCPEGTTMPIQCEDGSYNNATGQERCSDCPPGFYCIKGHDVRPCPEGHYCLKNMGKNLLPCPPGTYNPNTGLSQLEQCLQCTAGMFCDAWGLRAPTGSCHQGFFCLTGVNIGNPDGNHSTGVGGPCPMGHYCPSGTSIPLPCPMGTYSDQLYLSVASNCTLCGPGMYCGSTGLVKPSGSCEAGFFCLGNAKTPTPLGSDDSGGLCPVSHYCPTGTAQPIPCPAGTYNNLSGQASCFPCALGYFCPENSTTYTDFPCPAGFYCPNGTKHATQFPCPRGYYNPESMTQSLDSCLPCPPGHYCEKEKLATVSGKCKAGWFCVSAAWTAQPFDLDNYTTANCLCPATATGGKCQPGFYCPEGSVEPIPCPPGAYCNDSGLSEPSGKCSPGYYCAGGARQPQNTDGITGNICPRGSYCGPGSKKPTPCPPGTFSDIQALSDMSECLPCEAGFYCESPGLTAPTNPCSEGFYCPPGQNMSQAFVCPAGHYCPEGSPSPQLCDSGTWQDLEGQGHCKACEAGYYCDNSIGPVIEFKFYPCPQGYYCPVGTRAATQYGCPPGTFGQSVRQQDINDCQPCSPGKYCASFALKAPSGDCLSGFWCKNASDTGSPIDGKTGEPCPTGSYCPSGTPIPIPCPAGTWSNSTGSKTQEECQLCPEGWYCNSTGLKSPSGRCAPGYYCTRGATSPRPTDGITGNPCTVGHFCPEGSIDPLPCKSGAYMMATHASECLVCPNGRYCITGLEPSPCPAGFYCPQGTGYDWQPCPRGTYSPVEGLARVSECRACDGGKYCAFQNSVEVTGECWEGYYCTEGADSPAPDFSLSGNAGPCPLGYYCPLGTPSPKPCPSGTFSNRSKLVSQSDCTPCIYGHYCGSEGLVTPSGECWEGFYCLQGAKLPKNPVADGTGGPCPPGHFCPSGTTFPLGCPAGTYNALEGQSSCSPCVEGYFCPSNTSSYEDNICPPGYYCPLGTESKDKFPCPRGTYNQQSGRTSVLDCEPCDAGRYCEGVGQEGVTGLCAAGYYCVKMATTPTPNDGISGKACPSGHFCVSGATAPQPCPLGYYSNSSQNSRVEDCLPCPPGFSCDRKGLISPSQACDAGFYCPAAQNSSRPAPFICAKGHQCPQGSAEQQPCSSGTYQDQAGQASCIPCPVGFFCHLTSSNFSNSLQGVQAPHPCPAGYYCPEGSGLPFQSPCPVGTFSNRTGLGAVTDCLLCPHGKYCDQEGLTEPTGDCWEGYYCIERSSSPNPTDGITGQRCPRGSYCPKGTVNILPCPIGHFGPMQGSGSEIDCLPCPPGLFCNSSGLVAATGKCNAGYYCTGSSKTAAPIDHMTGGMCKPGSYCPAGAAHPVPCDPGEYCNGFALSTPSGPCRAGYFCDGNAYRPDPPENVCPPGHYCPAGSKAASPCPPGSFAGTTGNTDVSHCHLCTPGFYCPGFANINATKECQTGYYCPSGQSEPAPVGFICPIDHHCPSGSSNPKPCPPGQYQDQNGQIHCKPCPFGKYCGPLHLPGRHIENKPFSVQPIDCPAGYYCIQGIQYPCPQGSYSNQTAQVSAEQCEACPRGKYCAVEGLSHYSGLCDPGCVCLLRATTSCPSDNITGYLCPPGHYCPQGSGYGIRCPAGTFGPRGGLSSVMECVLCTPGFYCDMEGLASPTGPCFPGHYCVLGARTGSPFGDQTGDKCPPGYFCPSGTDSPKPCPPGTYQPLSGVTSRNECLPCPGGKYCESQGQSNVSGDCSAGFYCVSSSRSAFPLDGSMGAPCPVGHYCPAASSQPWACRNGTYMLYTHADGCDICPSGHYCTDGNRIEKCLKGYYCPTQTGLNWKKCPKGTYGAALGLQAMSDCTPCDAGFFCSEDGADQVTGPCSPGYYCQMGVDTPTPEGNNAGIGGPCLEGTFCPPGSSKPTSCPAGSYSDRSRQSECDLCKPGYYCAESSTSFLLTPCWPGYYCPGGTSHPTQYPCPVGTYNNRTTAHSDLECLACPAGHVCDRKGLSAPSGLCRPGFYCPGGTCNSQTQIQANVSRDLGSHPHSLDQRGNFTEFVCPPGFYCPEGSFEPVPCDVGLYCEQSGLSAPTGLCTAGFLCEGTATIPNSRPCPVGHYCPEGTSYSKPCPPGTLLAVLGGAALTDCRPCPSGHYCTGYGLSTPSGVCSAGYYCPGGQIVQRPLEFTCSPGHFCPEGSANQTSCSPGHYQSKWATEECEVCPAGFFCQSQGVHQPIICPLGSYCPPGTASASQFFCPEGTYGNRTGMHNASDCLPCDPGMYCLGSGNIKPSGSCSAGYLCIQGATVPTPTDGITGKQCLPGSYCPAGSITARPCPKGTFSEKRGLTEASHCQSCTPGQYCNEMGAIAVSGPCQAGFFCLKGSQSPAPTGDICPPGHYCPKAAAVPIPCPSGTFRSTTQGTSEEDCALCPSGFYCSKMGRDSAGEFCDPGFYCKEGAKSATPLDGITGDICPVGHYCPSGSAVPTPCENGKFVNHTGAEECFTCPEGYQCTNREQAEPCPQGSYCPKGTGISPQPCPVGTFGASQGLRKISDCTPCLGGFYCSSLGLTQTEGPCDPGFFCVSGVNTPRPSMHFNHTGNGGECSAGAYCPRNSTLPTPCPPGTYNSETGQGICQRCLAGYFCFGGLSNPFPQQCPSGHYCPESTRFANEYPCPPGTYGSLLGQESSAGCLSCPPGQFCEGNGLSTPSGNCSAGWFCTGGASTSKPLSSGKLLSSSNCGNPESVSSGNRCPLGSFCPEGSSLPQKCTAGYYCDQHELAEPIGPCDAGYYCPSGSTDRAPDQFKCIEGHYCPEGSAVPEPCPEATYSTTAGNKALDNCLPCTQGFFCEGIGLLHPTGVCSSGYYCPGGQNSPTPADFLCPAGSRCPAGSSSPEPCPRGFYQALTGQRDCNPCPTGTYCSTSDLENRGIKIPQLCPSGHFCPVKTEFATQYKCPRGTFSNKEGQTSAAQCDPCPPGLFCSQEAQTEPSGSCSKGFYCLGGATTPTPTDGITGDICPAGKYCVAGSTTGVDCPVGYYSNKTGLTSPDDCTICDPGFYCNRPGMTSPQGPCAAGHYCKLGAQTPDPNNGTEGFLCPAGYYCTTGTTRPASCPVGTYNPSKGMSSSSDCLPCKPGHYCSTAGQAQPSGLCFEGFYCTRSASQPNPQDGQSGGICPVGFYCKAGAHNPVPCPATTFLNHSGGAECVMCPAGFYCTHGNRINLCPPGFYCPASTGVEIPACPVGTYGGRTGLKEEKDCLPCKGGFYCAQDGLPWPQEKCDPGHYCTSGVNIPNPGPTQEFLGIGGKCGVGQHCPAGSAQPQPCPSGTYAEEEGMGYCQKCPPGYYCQPTAATPEPCLPGYYCPSGTEEATQYPCPPGTYNEWPGSRSEGECETCPPGQHCSGVGLTKPSGPCAAGYYCTGGSSTSEPTTNNLEFNTFLNSTSEWTFSLEQNQMTGGLCPVGYYCPPGSPSPVPCDAGTYCSDTKLFAPTGGCNAGYYCNTGSTQPDQHICPAGFYCPDSTAVPIPCLAGTYSNNTGNEKESDCQLCLSGQFCEGHGNVAPDGPCLHGFYCPPGQSSASPTSFLCPPGHYCPSGTSIPLACQGGTYQMQEGQEICESCPAGFFCEFSNGFGGNVPELCPMGFVCPPGTALGTEHPCAAGTYGPLPGAANEAGCLPCSPGMFCASSGLSNPSGLCYPGYYCTGSAVTPTPSKHWVNSDNATFSGNDICPMGHFCPEGSKYPLPCPAGTYSPTTGLTSEDQCQHCPIGHYCSQLGLTDLNQAQLCDPGYICYAGSTVPCPSDGIKGYVCPSGVCCPPGTISELPCNPGTYNPFPGAGSCLPCPAGTMCINSSTVEPVLCPRGYYCFSKTSVPVPCPEGTYNTLEGASSIDACVSCPAGFYCQGVANSEPDGPCIGGYYCQGGARVPILHSDPVFPLSGPCTEGHYCPTGTKAPIPCPVGTFKNTTGGASLESCIPCHSGNYCAREGLSHPSGLCIAGFYCPAHHSSPYSFFCPQGHFCPEGSGTPIPCPMGKYQPNSHSGVCIPCQAGFYCDKVATVEHKPCPPHFYCPEGTVIPVPCRLGTFTWKEMSGLKEEKQCLPCPTGKYCREGKIQGNCAAGYFCLAGSFNFTPPGILPNASADYNPCKWGQSCAGPCPAGFFCPEGTEVTKPCPANTIRLLPGGRQQEDCQPCPPGYWCKEGDPILYRCPAGYFCDGVIQVLHMFPVGPQKCPVHTYSNVSGAASQAVCQTCPPGYFCNETGLTTYENYKCPLGYWCPGKGNLMPCPGGTVGNKTGAASYKDCQPCAPGYYCPDPKQIGQPNINGVPCRAGYECLEGSVSEVLCRAGSYCSARTGVAFLCPGGYFCPLGSHTYNTPEQLCMFPYFCPANSSSMLPCYGGYMPINVTGLRDQLVKACLICEAGTYRGYSAAELYCRPCPAGFHCPKGSASYLSHPCPVGYYCAEKTTLPVPCPPGTYGNSSHAKHLHECYPCPENTFNHLPAQRACFPCGSTSYSGLGSTTCECHGLNRAFQESDGSCICKTGYVYYNEADQKSSNSNSGMDCYPEVDDRCSTNEARLASSRRCILPEHHNCTPFCGESGGKLDVELGICHCNKYISAEELCDRVCVAGTLNVSASIRTTGEFVLTIQNGMPKDQKEWVVAEVLGPEEHISKSPRVHFIHFEPAGIFGWILSGKNVVDEFLAEPEQTVMSVNPQYRSKAPGYLKRTTSRELHGGVHKIPNPIVCLKPKDLILFKLNIYPRNQLEVTIKSASVVQGIPDHGKDFTGQLLLGIKFSKSSIGIIFDRSLSHYPVYQKDHLFNTNSEWDFGSFRKLDHFIRETNFNITRFAHAFMEPGKYVFHDNAEKDWTLIVSVSMFGAECDSLPVQPSSPFQLVRHGILKRQNLNLTPDWILIIGTLSVLAVMTALFTMATLMLKPIQSSLNPMQQWKPKWRSLGEPYVPPEYVILRDSLDFYQALGPRGAGEGAETEEESTHVVAKRQQEMELEDFSVHTLFDKLEDQNLHLASQLSKQKNDLQAFYRHISQQIHELKELLECLNPYECQNMEGKWIIVDKLETSMTADAETSDKTKGDGVSQQLEELFFNLHSLVYKINSGHITISKEMIEKAQELYGSPSSLDMPTQDQIKPERLDHVDSAKKSSAVQIQETCSSLTKEEVPIPDSNLPYNEELTEILLSYPLLKRLEEIKQTLINHQHELQAESHNNLPDPTPLSDNSLIPADLGNLSPHHFVIYRFGCSITHLLYSSCDHTPLTLLMADDVPNEQGIHCKNRSYTNGFYYDANNRILYIKSTWLNNVGQFIVLILHVMAHVKAGIQINDDHPIFTEEFDHAVTILATTLFQMFFDTTSSMAEVHQDAEISDSKNEEKNKLVPSTQSIFEDLIHIKVPPETKFMEKILNERLKKYTIFKLHNVLQQILKSTDSYKGFSVQKARRMTDVTSGVSTETDNEHAHFNIFCKTRVLLDYIKQSCHYETEAEIDLADEHGEVQNLLQAQHGCASDILTAREVYVLLGVNRPASPSKSGYTPLLNNDYIVNSNFLALLQEKENKVESQSQSQGKAKRLQKMSVSPSSSLSFISDGHQDR